MTRSALDHLAAGLFALAATVGFAVKGLGHDPFIGACLFLAAPFGTSRLVAGGSRPS